MRTNRIIYLLVGLIFVVFIISLQKIILGTFPFWFDPARDLSMALLTHQKISLIGQTSGIPGIFYGPYWIWIISIALLFSKDPRFVVIVVLLIPYFVGFSYILWIMRNIFGKLISLSLALIFLVSFNNYPTQIWNPHLAPLFCLLTIYLLISADYQKEKVADYKKIFIAGIIGGLLVNLHISFGLVVVLGSALFLFLRNNRIKSLPLFLLGNIIAFLPFFVFEYRHGFNQIKTLIFALRSNSSIVADISNIRSFEIIYNFIRKLSVLLQIPDVLTYLILVIGLVYLLKKFRKKYLFKASLETNLVLLIFLIIISFFSIYLSTKNPVWEYHFIGIEVLFLLLIGFVSRKSKYLMYLLIVWAIILSVKFGFIAFLDLKQNPYRTSSLITKEHIVKTIFDDANGRSFSVFVYSPAVFTPDYNYLLTKFAGDRKSINFQDQDRGSDLIYLIIPFTSEDLKADFIDNKTPNKEYKTLKSWHIADETTILKRQRIKKN